MLTGAGFLLTGLAGSVIGLIVGAFFGRSSIVVRTFVLILFALYVIGSCSACGGSSSHAATKTYHVNDTITIDCANVGDLPQLPHNLVWNEENPGTCSTAMATGFDSSSSYQVITRSDWCVLQPNPNEIPGC